MSLLCMSPDCKHEIPDGSRCLNVALSLNWGDDDLRADSAKTLTFHSFGCLSDWAAERAADHDGHTVTEGQA